MHPAPLVDGDPLTRRVIGVFFDVYNRLGYGFLESVYAKSMEMVLVERGFHVAREAAMKVVFEGKVVGQFRADLIVNHCLILELKAGPVLFKGDTLQLCNYLRAANLPVGLLLHFGPEPKVKRVLRPGRSS